MLPALYYSLNTPFDLIDDYADWGRIRLYDDAATFGRELRQRFADDGLFRFRPFYDFYIGATWKVFGPAPLLHRLSPWAWHLAALSFFAAALLRLAPLRPAASAGGGGGRIFRAAGRLAPLLPLAFLLYSWCFFPNFPAARLSNQEVYTVCFLGLCTWVAALALTVPPGPASPRKALLLYGLFGLGYAGLVFAKETNLGVAGWLLLAYFVYAWHILRTGAARTGAARTGAACAGRAAGWKLLLGGAPLLLLFGVAFWRIGVAVSNNGAGYSTALTGPLIQANAAEIIVGLFQAETSLLIAAVFGLLLAVLLLSCALEIVRRRRVKRRWNAETAFVLLLLGQFAAMLVALSMSWGVALRYWYILLPVFALLLALGVKRLLEWCAAGGPGLRGAAVIGLAAFLVFFVAANYYNFLWQTLMQHGSRQAEAQLLARITALAEAGEYVQVSYEGIWDGAPEVIGVYYRSYLPRFYGQEYAVHRQPPADPARPYYLVVPRRRPLPLPADTAITHSDDYAVLAAARRVAGWLQGGTPHRSQDLGVYGPGEYRWNIYHLPYNFDAYAANLPQEYGPPAARGGGWLVYLLEGWIAYVKAPCGDADTAEPFFLHLIPAAADDLPPANRELGFVGRDFHFAAPYDFRTEATCIAVRKLPEYAISRIRTGQYIPYGDQLWRVEFPAAAQPGSPPGR